MILAWPTILTNLRQYRSDDETYGAAQDGVRLVAEHIAHDSRYATLSGWTSMHDLCVQQTEGDPYSVPYLRIAPQQTGTIAFRYVDTLLADRQWHREERPDRAVRRLESVFEQLHWF